MSYDRNIFIDKLYQIEQKKKQIKDLQNQQDTEEKAIAIQYKVEECNTKRNTVRKNYQSQINNLISELKTLKEGLI